MKREPSVLPAMFRCLNCRMTFRTDEYAEDGETTRCQCGIRFGHFQRKSDATVILRADLNDRRTIERINP